MATGHLHTAAMPWNVFYKQEPKMLQFMTDSWVLFFTGNSAIMNVKQVGQSVSSYAKICH